MLLEVEVCSLLFQPRSSAEEGEGGLSIYKPPEDLNFEFAENLKHNIKSLWDKDILEIMLLGDFIMPEINWETRYPNNLAGLSFAVAEILHGYGFSKLNTFPSREENDNILDLVLSNHLQKITELQCYTGRPKKMHHSLFFPNFKKTGMHKFSDYAW